MATTLDISELFYSIQGESTFAGLPCVFIRLAGCNLRCHYCDARYTYEEAHAIMEIDAILDFVAGYPGAMVEITGGEPLLQDGVYTLMRRLAANGHRVLLETNGSLAIDKVPAEVVVIMDIKTPGSGSAASLHPENLTWAQTRNQARPASCEIKFVLTSREDYLWAQTTVREHKLTDSGPVLFSPAKGQIIPADLANWLLQDRLPVRLQLQLHTLIWPHQLRGV